MYEEFKRVIPFSENEYLTPDEIKAKYNLPDISKIWERVKDYRSLFRYSLSLKTPSKAPYSLTFNRNVLLKLSSLERNAFSQVIRFFSLSNKGKKEFQRQSDIESLSWISDNYKLNLSEKDIGQFIDEKKEAEPKTKIVFDYLLMEKKLSSVCVLDYSSLFIQINNALLDTADNSNFQIRTTDEVGRGFQCPKNFLKGQLDDLFSFLEDEEDIPFFAKIIAGIYQYSYLEPCAYFSNETGSLLFKAFLSDNGFGEVGRCFPFEGIFFEVYSTLLNKAKISLKSGDLTYFLLACVPYLQAMIERISQRIDKILEKDEVWKEEEKKEEIKVSNPLPIVEGIGKEKYESMSSDAGIYSQETSHFELPPSNIKMVSVPSYSSGKYPKESQNEGPLEEQINKLMEKYPVLRRNVAHFYLTHQSIGSFYTISQFKTYEGVAYETARTSMDLLSNLGFYTKSKTAKKFVYTPLPKK